MKTTKIAFLTIVIVSAVAQAGQIHDKGAFSISIPDEWIEIPADIIETYNEALSGLAPKNSAQIWDYGFQSDHAESWLEHPYILIRISDEGRLSESLIEKIEAYPVQQIIDKHKKNMDPAAQIQAGKMYYDKTAKLIWIHAEASVAGAESTSGLSAMIPTENGYILVSGSSLRKDYATYGPVFRSSAMSVTPSHELVYQARWPDSTECKDSFASGLSEKVDEYWIAAGIAATEALKAEVSRESVKHVLETSQAIQEEWVEIKSMVSRSHVDLARRIEERVYFLRFFTFMLFVAKDSGGSFSLPDLESFGVGEETVARIYAAIPLDFLRYMESSLSSAETDFSFAEPPFDLQVFAGQGYPSVLSEMYIIAEKELMSELDALCKAVQGGLDN